MSAARSDEPITLFLVRHGDRWDYANSEAWKKATKAHGLDASDPPLSAVGLEQARCVAAALKDEGIDSILASPYVRVLQTAQPLAQLLGMPIRIEEGLAEIRPTVRGMSSPGARFAYFPEIDLDYKSLGGIVAPPPEARCETFPAGYLLRMRRMARLLSTRPPSRRMACFSHAAAVALVAALLRKPVLEVGKFAPAGIFKLVSKDEGASWELVQHGGDNSRHISVNAATVPWGYADLVGKEAEDLEGLWLQTDEEEKKEHEARTAAGTAA